MDVVGHQAIAPDLDMRPPRRLGEQIEVKRIVAVLEEDLRAPIAALGDMVGNAGEDETSEAELRLHVQ